ncbi:MAG: class I SAM-dependent methyltransferase [Pseudomonadota bacterium]
MAYSKEQFEQLANPKGDAGVGILKRLNCVNENINRLTLETLGEVVGREVLEVGFGGGALLSKALTRFPRSKFHGTEISHLAIDQAQNLFADEINEERISLHHFDGDVLPFLDEAFDAVIAVNVIYFVSDLVTFLEELKRVLNAKGKCILAYAEGSPDRVTRFEKEQIEALLISVGFRRTKSVSSKDNENGFFHCSVGFMQE